MILIKDFKENENIEKNFLISGVTKGMTTKGAPYLNLVLQDSSGTIDGKKWEVNESDEEIFRIGKVVKVKGDILSYRGSLQLRVNSGEVIEDDKIDLAEFIKSAPMDKELLKKTLFDFIKLIENKDIKDIVEEVVKNNFISFTIYPAASKNHHAYASGLLQHTVTMLKLAKALVEIYPSLDKDYLYAGVILHDIGKTTELSGPIITQYTTVGRLVGHINIIQAEIKQAADKLGIGGEVPIVLQHLVLSHHGKYEFGSPVLPLTREAEILSFIDNIDSKMNMIDKALEELQPGEFTNRLFALEDRAFYKTKKDNKKESGEK